MDPRTQSAGGLKRSRSSSGSQNSMEEEGEDDRRHKRIRSTSPILFEISTQPDPERREGSSLISYTYIDPSPTNPFALLTTLGESIDPPPTTTSSTNRNCFNCNQEGHTLSTCTLPKDFKTISNNRLQFQLENPSTGEAAGGGGKLGGEENERSRRLNFVERFKPGIVGDELRFALGFGASISSSESGGREGKEEIIEYPWFSRFLQWGYPKGFTMIEGGQDPFEALKDRIGRDINWDTVEILKLFHGEEDEEEEESVSPSTPPSPPPPLPPSTPPPPLPIGLPPPLPLIHLVHYPTNQFDSNLLSVYQSGSLLPLTFQVPSSQVFNRYNNGNGYYQQQRQREQYHYSPRSIPLPPSSPLVPPPPPAAAKEEVREESESEMEMEMDSSSEDEEEE